MSILAASVCLGSGEILLSRQFVELSAPRVHEMLSVISLLLNDNSDRTTLEENGLRYICEPLDELYVVLISDAESSNILQDLKTLHLITQLVKQVAAPNATNVEENDVINSTFSIIDALDEVVTMGFSENLTESQVETFMKMESYEERIQQIIEHNKQLEAAEHRKRMAKKLEAERQSHPSGPSGFGSSSSGFGSDSAGFSSSGGFGPGSSGGFGSGGVPSSASQESASLLAGLQEEQPKPVTKHQTGTGLKLGKSTSHAPSSSASNIGSGLPPAPKPLVNNNLPAPSIPAPAAAPKSKQPSVAPVSTTTDISINEQLTIEALRDGSIKQSRASGTLSLVAGDREHTKLRIKATTEGTPSNYKPHPKMDRALFASERILGLKNGQEEFPASQVLLVKWTADNVPVPLNVSCWISDSADAGFKAITLEYEVAEDKLIGEKLEDIAIKVPLPTSNAHVADPALSFEQFDDHIVWSIPEITLDEPTGSFEFAAEANEEDDFYPLEVSFRTPEQQQEVTTFGKIDVASVTDLSTNEEIDFTKTAVASTASYIIR